MVYCITALAEHKDLGGGTADQVRYFCPCGTVVSCMTLAAVSNRRWLRLAQVLPVFTHRLNDHLSPGKRRFDRLGGRRRGVGGQLQHGL